jgi:hypothetical protein
MLRKLAVTLSVPADVLLFDDGERGPADDLRLQFEAIQHLDPDERESLKTVIDGVITRHEVRRLARTG